VSIGTRTLSPLPQVMRLRRAVPKTPAKPSVSPRLPFYKSRFLPTPSKSTLLQVLIPLHFNSRRCNAYKKPGEGAPPSAPKVLQLVTTRSTLLRTHSNARNPNRVYGLLHGSHHTPGWGGTPSKPRTTNPAARQCGDTCLPTPAFPAPTRVTLLARC
jgi:hypothetical protein